VVLVAVHLNDQPLMWPMEVDDVAGYDDVAMRFG
jgi:hypothetical protein